MSAKVPHTHGFGIFFQKSVTHGVTAKIGTYTSYRINLIPLKSVVCSMRDKLFQGGGTSSG
mgnify:CR=1 FL=1